MVLEHMTFCVDPECSKSRVRRPRAEDVVSFADSLGVTFSEDYISLVVRHAGRYPCPYGGYIDYGERLDGTVGRVLNQLDILFHYDKDREGGYSVQYTYDWYRENFDIPLLVPFWRCLDDGDLAFDFRASRTQPSIVCTNVDHWYNWDHRYDELILEPIADSLAELFGRMMMREEFEPKYGKPW